MEFTISVEYIGKSLFRKRDHWEWSISPALNSAGDSIGWTYGTYEEAYAEAVRNATQMREEDTRRKQQRNKRISNTTVHKVCL